MKQNDTPNKKELTKNQRRFLEALKGSLGNVSKASDISELGRGSHYRWMEENQEYKQMVDEIADGSVDFVESKLFELIDGVDVYKKVDGMSVVYSEKPNVTAIIWYLKANPNAKKRGWGEHIEVKGDPIPAVIKIVKPDELEKKE